MPFTPSAGLSHPNGVSGVVSDAGATLSPMSDIDTARDQLRAALANADAHRPQDAGTLTADLAYLVPVIATLTATISEHLAGAERLPGLYTTTGGNPRAELHQARAQLAAAQVAADTLAQRLDAAHNTLAALGHGPAGEHPLAAVEEPPEGIQQARRWRAPEE